MYSKVIRSGLFLSASEIKAKRLGFGLSLDHTCLRPTFSLDHDRVSDTLGDLAGLFRFLLALLDDERCLLGKLLGDLFLLDRGGILIRESDVAQDELVQDQVTLFEAGSQLIGHEAGQLKALGADDFIDPELRDAIANDTAEKGRTRLLM